MSTCVVKDCRRPTWEKSKHCIDHHPGGLSGPSLAVQLQKARDEIADLEAELRATRAVVVTERMEKNATDFTLLEEIAAALLLASEVEKAIGGSAPSHSQLSRVKRPADYPTPGAATAAARGSARRLRRDLAGAVQTFNEAKHHDWRPPRPDPVPRLRCGVRGCTARDVEVPAWRFIRGGRRIVKTHCEACGTALPGAETEVSA